MNDALSHRYAVMALKLLLGIPSKSKRGTDGEAVDWAALESVARAHVVLRRCHQRLAASGVQVAPSFSEAAAHEETRIQRTVALMKRLSMLCAENGIPHLFPKAFQHDPDMGHDVDLFVLDRSSKIDSVITQAFEAVPIGGSLFNGLSGKTGYELRGELTPLEIHHGRMGHIGEHTVYPGLLFQRAVTHRVGGLTFRVPSPEDQLIIQALQRIYGHLSIRVSDVVHTVALVRGSRLNWSDLENVARRIGLYEGLTYYLAAIRTLTADHAHEELFPPEAPSSFRRKPVPVSYRAHTFRFPVIPVVPSLYLRKFFHEFMALNGGSVMRMSLLPGVAGAAALRGMVRKMGHRMGAAH